MDTYCWIHSTFSIPSRWVGKQGHQVPHPGISPLADLNDGTDVKYHKYYQWVCFVLFLQAAFFYLPRYFWKTAEGGKVRLLIQGLQVRFKLLLWKHIFKISFSNLKLKLVHLTF